MPRLACVLPGRCGALLLASIAVALSVVVAPTQALMAGWEPTGIAERTVALRAPTSGAFFATTESGVLRSDDGGISWRPVPLPPALAGDTSRRSAVVVDPNDHTRMFVDGWVTRDDGATWSQLGAWPVEAGEGANLVVSPADPSLLYLALTREGMGTSTVRMLRSRDGGGSWEQFLGLGPGDFRPSSSVGVTLFEAHPTDPNVLFQTVVGFTGHFNQGILRRSADQGATTHEVLYSASRYPTMLVGGRGINSGRFYCALSSSDASRELYRSDDDAVTWTKVASYEVEGERITSLEYDPSEPDRVYVAISNGSVRRSNNGGQSWTDLGLADQKVNGLALGVDGGNLYAATDQGVFKMPLR